MVKLGMISYLNTAPFRYGFSGLEGVELVEALPANLLHLVEDGEVEAAIMPAFDALSHPELAVIPGTCIASLGAAWSVKLFTRIALRFATTVALDTSSHSSAALVRLVLEEHGAHPMFVNMPPDLDAMLARADAALLIGDPCLQARPAADIMQVDLGEEWHRLTGLPFVFGLWAARPGADIAPLAPVISEALDRGLQHLDRVVEAEAGRAGLPPEGIMSYLRDYMRYHLDESCLAGLEQFRQRLVAAGLLAEAGPVRVGA